MSANPNQPMMARHTLIAFVLIEIVLFVIANVTAKTSSNPGLVSQITWWAFVIGVVAVVVTGLTRLVRSRRTAR